MASRHDYSQQASTYDSTRAASPSVLTPLSSAFGNVHGTVLDVGGGTGNYAAGLRAELDVTPVVLDRSAEMLAVAASKGLRAVRGDAEQLPLASASVDAVMLVSMLHHVVAWREALAEARRVVCPGGVVALLAFVREHLRVHWAASYFPATTAAFRDGHQSMAELISAFPGCEVTPVHYHDLVDGSLAAMCRHPASLLDADVRRQTSFFERAERDHPEELAVGLERLEADLAEGRAPDRDQEAVRREIGDATLITWTAVGRQGPAGDAQGRIGAQ